MSPFFRAAVVLAAWSPALALAEPCAEGTAAEVVACRKELCPTKVREASPKSLTKLGWRAFVCDDGGAKSDGAEPTGLVWLYRVEGERLRYATLLTTFGARARDFTPASFTLVDAKPETVTGRTVHRLKWKVAEKITSDPMCGTEARATTFATFCTEEGRCTLTLPTEVDTRFTPFARCKKDFPAERGTVALALTVQDDAVTAQVEKASPPVSSGENHALPLVERSLGRHGF